MKYYLGKESGANKQQKNAHLIIKQSLRIDDRKNKKNKATKRKKEETKENKGRIKWKNIKYCKIYVYII